MDPGLSRDLNGKVFVAFGVQDQKKNKDTPKVNGHAVRSCVTQDCHADYKEKKFPHAPIVLGQCLPCHVPDEDSTPYEEGDDHSFELAAKEGILCQKCHESQATDRVVHNPIKRHRCVECHDPHGADNPALMIQKNIADNCFECHEDTMRDDASVHSPVALGQCTVCHDSHSSSNSNLLIAKGSDLCLSCHSEKEDELAKHRFAHRPVLEDCSKCHDPHDGADTNRLKKKVPDLCLSCHKDVKKSMESRFKHGGMQEKDSCLECHDPHTSDFSRQLKEAPMDLCLSCHGEPLVAEDRIIKDMKQFLKENDQRHGPIREGDCGACHNAHGSKNTRLLRKAYPNRFYTEYRPDSYPLCFSCHERSLVQEKEGEKLTGYRNGKTNLHTIHVNRGKKGRTCRACHDVHATKNPKHIVDSVPFGKRWQYTIDFKKTKNGGSCGAACHVARSYDRKNPVKNK
jgi:predicted CXXCH cytochrome family protein